MATILPPVSSLQFPNTFTRASPSPKPNAPPKLATRATDSDSSEPSQPESSSADDAFEARLNRVRYRSGTGKKAELRKTRKSKSKSTSTSPSGSMYLPPVPLKEPVSGVAGMKVDFGFSPYSERVNGWVATVGLAALLSVELATGKSVLSYHTPAILLVQVYFVAAATTLFVKYEKERISVWPDQSSTKE